MYSKVMAISDDRMWRYYELLTDESQTSIDQFRAQVNSGDRHPMAMKQHLARAIVKDFHGQNAAFQAEADWSRQVRDRQTPDSVDLVEVRLNEVLHASSTLIPGLVTIRLDKLVHKAGFASSVTEAQRKREQGSVRITGDVRKEPWIPVTSPPVTFDMRVGRIVKQIRILPDS